MDFVEAVRRGCELTSPTTSLFVKGDQHTSTCILGAALVGVGLPIPSTTAKAIEMLREIFPILSDGELICPEWHSRPRILSRGDMAVHLNDQHRWDRLRTAQYISEASNG